MIIGDQHGDGVNSTPVSQPEGQSFKPAGWLWFFYLFSLCLRRFPAGTPVSPTIQRHAH